MSKNIDCILNPLNFGHARLSFIEVYKGLCNVSGDRDKSEFP